MLAELWLNFWIHSAKWLPLVFFTMIGACVGSLTNVIVWRMPRGEDIVSPPSACPKCHTKLTWRENIPIFGWIFLRGKCRFCKSKISAEYPIVESLMAAIFAFVYWMLYIAPPKAMVLGINFGAIAPAWVANEPSWGNWPSNTWPMLVILLGLFACLFAMTVIDARTFTIPIELCWFIAILGVVGHTFHAVYFTLINPNRPFVTTTGDWFWTIPTPNHPDTWWWWIGASICATVGLGISCLLMKFKIIGRSFADYEQWEAQHIAALAAEHQAANPDAALTSEPEHPPDLWIQYPHARREMVRELAFLAPAGLLGWLGGFLFQHWFSVDQSAIEKLGGAAFQASVPPLWLMALSGALLGYLVGGALIWGIRILGTLAFGKEAMGMGDVHLMAGIGACLGWIDPIIATFVLAPFLALMWWVLSFVFARSKKMELPYGPWLAGASVLCVVAKPLVEAGITAVFRSPTPIQWP
jgi:leader peptidase (prepilin peptidase)/N-methyltransferase